MQYIARLYMRGIAYLGLAIFLSYSLIVFLFPQDMVQTPPVRFQNSMAGIPRSPDILVQRVNVYMDSSFYTSRPWPANFAAWLFNTRGRGVIRGDNQRTVEEIVPGTEGEAHGILAGDLGYSWDIYRDEPAVNMLGQKPWLLPFLTLAVTLELSLLALLKMRRRGPAYASAGTRYVEPHGENYFARAALTQAMRIPH